MEPRRRTKGKTLGSDGLLWRMNEWNKLKQSSELKLRLIRTTGPVSSPFATNPSPLNPDGDMSSDPTAKAEQLEQLACDSPTARAARRAGGGGESDSWSQRRNDVSSPLTRGGVPAAAASAAARRGRGAPHPRLLRRGLRRGGRRGALRHGGHPGGRRRLRGGRGRPRPPPGARGLPDGDRQAPVGRGARGGTRRAAAGRDQAGGLPARVALVVRRAGREHHRRGRHRRRRDQRPGRRLRGHAMVSWNATGDCEGDECRPRLVGFIDSKDVRIHDITLNQPAYWCLHLVRCDNTVIRNVSIYGDFDTPNNDGIDIEDSNNTIITDCHIDTGDDAICPKSSAGPVYNLTVTNCWIRTKSCAVKFGSASTFNFERLLFDNITIVDSHRGLGMQIRDGGNVSDVVFSNIKMRTRYYHPSWWGRAEPIYITTCPRHPDSKEGTISDVSFINISSVSENGVFLAGSRHGLLRNLKFKNVDLTYKRWTNYTGGLYDYRPGCQAKVKHRTGGMMLEHISGLEIDNVKMRWSKGSLKGWDVNPLLFRPSTIDGLSFHDWQSLDVQ